MPGGGNAFAIGGGINLSGGAIDEFLVLTSVTPPTATTTTRWRRSGSELIAETVAGREDTVIGIGSSNAGIAAGVLRPDVIFGRNISNNHGASGANNASVLIGSGLTVTQAANVIIVPGGISGTVNNVQNVIIGALGVAIPNLLNTSVLIGHDSGGAGGNTGMTVVGQSARGNANTVVVIGNAATASSANNVSIGQAVSTTSARCIAIGQGHGSPNADQIKIGHGGTNAGGAGQILIGNGIVPASVGANEICMGHEGLGGGAFTTGFRFGQNQHTSGVAVPAYTVTWKSALGTDIAAGSVTFVAPKATGNAAAGSFIFQTSPAGASGATLQTATTRLTIDPNGGVTLATPSAAAENLVIAGFGGAGQASIRLNNLTSGAGAAVGTLNNAPAAGDPAFWIPVNIAGTVRNIPAW